MDDIVKRLLDYGDRSDTEQHEDRNEAASEIELLRHALRNSADAIDEFFRYWHGGEARGSYDGKPEREGLLKAGTMARRMLS